MTFEQAKQLFIRLIPATYPPTHMLCHFAANATEGRVLPFLASLLGALVDIEAAISGYSKEVLGRIAAIKGTGEPQYERILQIIAEVYVTRGVTTAADVDGFRPVVNHEPAAKGTKNPECEALIQGHWCAFEVKAPKLIAFGRERKSKDWQFTTRLPHSFSSGFDVVLPRDNPVKDFIVSAEEKFAAYERNMRQGALRLLVIVWDDYSHEPIAALTSPVSGLLTPRSFYRDASGDAAKFAHVDGVVVIRHQHQIIRATRCEPLVDGLRDCMCFHFKGFPPKAFIPVPGGRDVPEAVLSALGLTPLDACIGAEYQPVEAIMWIGHAPQAPSERDVRERAYQNWISRGRPLGDDWADWFRAEHQLRWMRQP